MSNAARSALIAIDWGTTSARAYRVDAQGEVIASRSAPLGIGNVADGNFRAALDLLLDDWAREAVPSIACGMIGSRQGWVEAPYVDCPAGLADFAGALSRTPGGELLVVPGARCRDADGVPDLMRGEETQLAGALGPAEEAAFAVLPGTHSKWARVERGRLAEFATYMTGELYAALLEHSILGRMAERPTPSDGPAARAAFGAGVARGLAGGGLSHAMFGARTLALAGALGPAEAGEWLSGLLIGHEVGAARAWVAGRIGDGCVRVIGEASIVARYLDALAQAGVPARPGPADAAARGLFLIAQRAGLIH